MPTATKERGAHLGQGGANAFGIGRIKTEADLKRWLLSVLREPQFRILLTSGKFVLKNELAYDVTDHKVKGGPAVLTDQSAAINALIDGPITHNGFGGKMFFPENVYTVNDGIVNPENLYLVVEGIAPGWRSNLGRSTLLKRRANPAVTDQPMLQVLGSDSGDSERGLLEVRHIQFDGGADAGVTNGEGLQIQRGQENFLERARFYNFPKTALRLTQVFNSTFIAPRITSSGDGTTDAAFHLGGAGTPGNVDGTITLSIFDLQMESNNGTDLKVTGNSVGVGHPATEINFVGGKFEGGVGVTAPYHHWEFAELVNVSSMGIFSHREVPMILSESLVTGIGEDRGVRYSNCWFEQAAGVDPPDYFIDHQGGALHFSNCTFKGTPNVAFALIDAAARAGSISFTGCQFIDDAGGASTVPTAVDNRTPAEF